MKSLLRKILRIQTIKLVLYNPANVRDEVVTQMSIQLPVWIVATPAVKSIKIIDTGIPIRWKKEHE